MEIHEIHNDETGQFVYEIPGYEVKVVVEPVDEDEVYVEVWDAAGLSSDRALRPADQSRRIALKTLFDNYREDQQTEKTEVAPASVGVVE